MYERLLQLLRNETLEEEPTWTVTMFPDFFAVEASTKQTASDPDGAWNLARNLCDSIIGLGYEFAEAVSRLGVESNWDVENRHWRGKVEMRLKRNEQ